ncbi:DinB/UmuC family translesion DNA polymerase [Spirosoma endophyticum]|uniref:DinB/UmuC family translesion DNA polymerase n=1 Tax=Spirosoma endophyticum TaxID=662367 RepID=UPI00373FDC23
MCNSRSFGHPPKDRVGRSSGRSQHLCQQFGQKLRKQDACTNVLTVFVEINRFRPNQAQYNRRNTVNLSTGSKTAAHN